MAGKALSIETSIPKCHQTDALCANDHTPSYLLVQVMYALPQGPDLNQAVISECGSMNMFFVFRKEQQHSSSNTGSQQYEVVTPPLDGTILPGITRDSITQLLRQ